VDLGQQRDPAVGSPRITFNFHSGRKGSSGRARIRAAASASTPDGVRDQLEAIKNQEQYHQPDSLAAATSIIADALAG
jgi:hypothetical protein